MNSPATGICVSLFGLQENKPVLTFTVGSSITWTGVSVFTLIGPFFLISTSEFFFPPVDSTPAKLVLVTPTFTVSRTVLNFTASPALLVRFSPALVIISFPGPSIFLPGFPIMNLTLLFPPKKGPKTAKEDLKEFYKFYKKNKPKIKKLSKLFKKDEFYLEYEENVKEMNNINKEIFDIFNKMCFMLNYYNLEPMVVEVKKNEEEEGTNKEVTFFDKDYYNIYETIWEKFLLLERIIFKMGLKFIFIKKRRKELDLINFLS